MRCAIEQCLWGQNPKHTGCCNSQQQRNDFFLYVQYHEKLSATKCCRRKKVDGWGCASRVPAFRFPVFTSLRYLPALSSRRNPATILRVVTSGTTRKSGAIALELRVECILSCKTSDLGRFQAFYLRTNNYFEHFFEAIRPPVHDHMIRATRSTALTSSFPQRLVRCL